MKIELIRHAKVKFTWKRFYLADAYQAACREYDSSQIDISEKKSYDCKDKKIYVSNLPRTYETAKLLFGPDIQVEKNALFDEVPMTSFCKRNYYLPCMIFNLLGRIQWYSGNKRQQEVKCDTIKRAEQSVDLMEKQGSDCIVITHGFYMRTLIKVLKQRGYSIASSKSYHNLDKVTLIKVCK